jgi:hypothetical protein
MRSWFIVALVAGCGLLETWTPVEIIDEGTVCIEGAADAMATVQVFVPGECLSSSCDRNRVMACTATLDGSTITVSSEFTWETASGPNVACTDDCGMLITECTVGPLPAGAYTVVHGDETSNVDIPAEEPCEVF